MIEKQIKNVAFSAGLWPLDPNKPTLVFIHGAGGSRVLWDKQVAAPADGANAVALDLPGHGSSPGDGFKTIEDYARAVADLIETAPFPKPVPVGLSMGGAITQTLLIERGDLVKAGVLISTGAKLKVMPAIFEAIEKNFPLYVDMIAKFAASDKTDPALLADFIRATAEASPPVAAGDFRACDAFDVRDRLGRIKTPTLIVSGDDDKLTPPKYSDFLEEKIAGAQRVRIAQAGHLCPLEKPMEVSRAIMGFLSGLAL